MDTETRIEQRMTLAQRLTPAILAEAEAEGIPLTRGGAYRLAWAAVCAVERQTDQDSLD